MRTFRIPAVVFCIALSWLFCTPALSAPLLKNDTVESAKDSIRRQRKEDRREAQRETNQEIKENILEKLEENESTKEILDAVKEITDIDLNETIENLKGEVDSLKGELKEYYNETKQKLKETYEKTKDEALEWFDENIVQNTVGDFAEERRQKNHEFAAKALKLWAPYPLKSRPAPALIESAFFASKDKGKSWQKPSEPITVSPFVKIDTALSSPKPENYFEGAGSDAVSRLMTKQQYVDIKFYGEKIRIYCAPQLRSISLGKGREKNFFRFWEYLSQQDFDPVLFQLYQNKESLGLPDYLYAQFVKTFADEFFVKAKNGENIGFTAFMLCQTGYDARIGRLTGAGTKGLRMVLLLPYSEGAVDAPYITVGDSTGTKDFYLMGEKFAKKDLATGTVYCYANSPDSAAASFSLFLNPNELKLKPVYGRFQMLVLNERLAEVELSWPGVSAGVLADMPFDVLLQKALQFKFKPLMDSAVQKVQDADLRHTLTLREKQQIQAMGLLDFLENYLSAASKNSAKLAGRTLYPDLMLFKKGSGDVIDRSLLCAQIAGRILGIETVVLLYPGYAVPAMAFEEGEDWAGSPFAQAETFVYNGKTYVLCGKRPQSVVGLEAEILTW